MAVSKCSKCVHWILNRCNGDVEPCEDLETYDDWDYSHANIGEIE